MARSRGPGWWEQPRKHADAARKGWKGRRKGRKRTRPTTRRQAKTSMVRSEAAERAWVTRSTPSEVVARERARDEDARSDRAIKMDRSRQAETVYSPKDPDEVMRWKKNKGRSDLAGVDTLFRRLTRIKRKTKKKVQETRVRRKKIIRETKEKVERIKKDPEKPREVKKREIRQAVKQAEVEVEAEHKVAVETIQKAQEEQTVEVTRHQEKWDRERRRRAEYVAETTGCSILEADALIQRANNSGYDYDKVDWDQVQGRDLTYGERVDKLERAIGRQTATKAERRSAMRNVDWVIDKYEQDEENWQTEIQGAMRDLYEEERLYQAEHPD